MDRADPADGDGRLRVYAIGDIHGRFDLLAKVDELIRDDVARHPPVQSVEVFLGDYVDRGPQSREVLEWLVASPPAASRRICLTGNHEAMLLAALEDVLQFHNWLMNGGGETMRSYGVAPPTIPAWSWFRHVQAEFRSAFPSAHHAFLQSLPRLTELGGYIFVHAGLNPNRALADQDTDELVWIREPFLSSRRDFGKLVVHGHTPVERPDVQPNRINIDTGAVFTGRLTCLVLDRDGKRFLTAEAH